MQIDIQIFDKVDESTFAQAKYLIHGSDVYWQDTIEEVLSVIEQELRLLEAV